MERDKPVSGEGWSDGHPEAADDPLAVTSTVPAPATSRLELAKALMVRLVRGADGGTLPTLTQAECRLTLEQFRRSPW